MIINIMKQNQQGDVRWGKEKRVLTILLKL